jgi:ferric-dicitrate binding protein FerR (iron transport regulator)
MGRPRTLLLLAVGTAAGVVIARRLLRGPGERVDLYFEDGSMVSLEGDSTEAQRLLPVARDLLSTVG